MDLRRQRFSFRFATGLVLAASALALSATVTAAAGPPPSLFKSGANLCNAASLPALGKAAGGRYAGCSRNPGSIFYWMKVGGGGLALYVRAGAKTTGPNDPRAVSSKSLSMPGASSAVLTTYKDKTKRLYALYPQGIVGITAIVDTTLSDAEMVAVMRLITHT